MEGNETYGNKKNGKKKGMKERRDAWLHTEHNTRKADEKALYTV